MRTPATDPAHGVWFFSFGTWRSLVAHLHGVQGVASSNLAVPTNSNGYHMMPNTLRTTGLGFIASMLIACAGTPPQQPANSPAPDTASSAVQPAVKSSANAAERRFEEAIKGYRLVEQDGQKHYCRSEKASGSNILQQNCVTENQLRAAVEDADRYRRTQRSSVCQNDDPRCGPGAN